MNKIQLIGIGLFSLGILVILAYSFYEFFLKAVDFPETIKISLLFIFLGLILVLVSLAFERIKELKK